MFQTLVTKQTPVLVVLAGSSCCCCCGGGGAGSVERAHALYLVREEEEVIGDGASIAG